MGDEDDKWRMGDPQENDSLPDNDAHGPSIFSEIKSCVGSLFIGIIVLFWIGAVLSPGSCSGGSGEYRQR